MDRPTKRFYRGDPKDAVSNIHRLRIPKPPFHYDSISTPSHMEHWLRWAKSTWRIVRAQSSENQALQKATYLLKRDEDFYGWDTVVFPLLIFTIKLPSGKQCSTWLHDLLLWDMLNNFPRIFSGIPDQMRLLSSITSAIDLCAHTPAEQTLERELFGVLMCSLVRAIYLQDHPNDDAEWLDETPITYLTWPHHLHHFVSDACNEPLSTRIKPIPEIIQRLSSLEDFDFDHLISLVPNDRRDLIAYIIEDIISTNRFESELSSRAADWVDLKATSVDSKLRFEHSISDSKSALTPGGTGSRESEECIEKLKLIRDAEIINEQQRCISTCTQGIFLGLDRWFRRFYILGGDFSRIFVQNPDGLWGYYNSNTSLNLLKRVLNPKAAREHLLLFNILQYEWKFDSLATHVQHSSYDYSISKAILKIECSHLHANQSNAFDFHQYLKSVEQDSRWSMARHLLLNLGTAIYLRNDSRLASWTRELQNATSTTELCNVLVKIVEDIDHRHVVKHFDLQAWSASLEKCSSLSNCIVLLYELDRGIRYTKLNLPFESDDDTAEPSAMHSDLEDQELEYCFICTNNHQPETMLLCDHCNHRVHMGCVSPIISSIPLGNWYCANCVPVQKCKQTRLAARSANLDKKRTRSS